MRQLSTSYKQILSISLPIMLGSAVQNIVALTDSVFLFYVSETDFAAIGFVSVFYLIIAAIGFGLSKGGQIMISRRIGEGAYRETARSFYALLYFSAILALVMYLFMQFGTRDFFGMFVRSQEIIDKSIAYLKPRSHGVFFSYVGMAIIALYTGIARTSFIVWDAILLAVVNIVLNYGLIYGKWFFPEMGIAGAGLASAVAEVVAFAAFVVYMFRDRGIVKLKLFRSPIPRLNLNLVWRLISLSMPVIGQAVLGIGSWFIFFGFIEHLGERPLAISNLARIIYLALSIPCWGYASGINTLVSNFIGMNKRQVVFPIVRKTAKIALLNTLTIALPILIWPGFFLYPLLGSGQAELLAETRPIFWLLIPILTMFAVGGIFINGLTGTGAAGRGLFIQIVSTAVYVAYVYIAVEMYQLPLVWVWLADIFYWGITIGMSYSFLNSRRWWRHEV